MPDRSNLKIKLQNIIDYAFPDIFTVALFGSSVNNLGFKSSDVDVTLIPKRSIPVITMFKLGRVLSKAGMTQIEPVAGARVPIVKCFDPSMRLSIDMNIGYIEFNVDTRLECIIHFCSTRTL